MRIIQKSKLSQVCLELAWSADLDHRDVQFQRPITTCLRCPLGGSSADQVFKDYSEVIKHLDQHLEFGHIMGEFLVEFLVDVALWRQQLREHHNQPFVY